VSAGLIARLRVPLRGRADLGEVLSKGWTTLTAAELARRPVGAEGPGPLKLGDLFDVSGDPGSRIRFEGDLAQADRVGAGLSEGEVIVESAVGDEAGMGMTGGSLEIRGDTGARAGGAALEARRGMTGGELIVRGSAGPEAGALMRRGLVAIAGSAGSHAGAGMIAGTVVVFGGIGAAGGLWSKRGSLVALGPVTVPLTYRYACTYQPVHLRVTLMRLRARYALPVEERHLTGFYRRYSGDLADLGKGEILAWTAE
jgi:formylmethanofuran dehydrogenase subunit C